MSISTELAEIFGRDLARLAQEIEAFPDDATLWRTLPGASNSAGNLALHLEGNLRDFIGLKLGGVAYKRVREAEFTTRELSRTELLDRIQALSALVPRVIGALTAEKLDEIYPQQFLNHPFTARQFLLHLHGHFNYHLGQIDYLRRILTGGSALELANL